MRSAIMVVKQETAYGHAAGKRRSQTLNLTPPEAHFFPPLPVIASQCGSALPIMGVCRSGPTGAVKARAGCWRRQCLNSLLPGRWRCLGSPQGARGEAGAAWREEGAQPPPPPRPPRAGRRAGWAHTLALARGHAVAHPVSRGPPSPARSFSK